MGMKQFGIAVAGAPGAVGEVMLSILEGGGGPGLDIPQVVPEINGEAIAGYRKRGIVANPNCPTIVAIMPLKPLHDFGTLKRVGASSYQATSGAGPQAMAGLIAQTKACAKGHG